MLVFERTIVATIITPVPSVARSLTNIAFCTSILLQPHWWLRLHYIPIKQGRFFSLSTIFDQSTGITSGVPGAASSEAFPI